MINREKDKLVAEAMGIDVVERHPTSAGRYLEPIDYCTLENIKGTSLTISDFVYKAIPKYTESLDACAEFELWLEDNSYKKYWDYVAYISGEEKGCGEYTTLSWGHVSAALRATAEQRVDAFLKVMGIETNAKAESHNM